ncbi:tetratricopeptide repeat protein [Streptomyces sp. NPDC055089]
MAVISEMAGVGKSALATRWLHGPAGAADARFYADLTHVSGPLPVAVLQQWLRALGVDRPPGQRSEAEALWRSLTDRRTVHVLIEGADDAGQARPLIPAGTQSRTVVTSRRSLWELAADGALLLPITPLPQEDSVQLLATASAGRLPPDSTATAHLVETCGHLPLALVLTAASLCAGHGPLTAAPTSFDCSRDPQERARMAITTALNNAYEGLETAAQDLYRAFGFLPDVILDADMAAAVCALSPSEAGWLLEVLADERLLDPAPGDAPEPRYRMNEAVRPHARTHAADAGTHSGEALNRLFVWMLGFATAAQRLLTPAQATLRESAPAPTGLFQDKAGAQAWLDGQADNLLPVLTAATKAGLPAWELTDAFWPHFLFRHPHALWGAAHEIGLDSARRTGNTDAVRQMLNSGAIGFGAAGEHATAADWYMQSLHAARAADDVRDEGQALLGLGACHLNSGRLSEAEEMLMEATARWNECGYQRGVGLAQITLSEVLFATDPRAALERLAAARTLLTGLGEHYEAAQALALHGRFLDKTGRSTDAIDELASALPAVRDSDRWQACVKEWLGDAHKRLGDREDAHKHWFGAAVLYDSINPDKAAELRARVVR